MASGMQMLLDNVIISRCRDMVTNLISEYLEENERNMYIE